MTPRVLLADDHPAYRDGLRLILESIAEIEAVGTVPEGRSPSNRL
ncbi:response regulator transcription factor [Actinomadura chibensis]|uniref:Response regulator transcription factor n=1 Tax=Actinomadura chibensis TaxID=392828 RepID=A0A5D0N6X9_9ACTN|nr:response regulator transcription factor [Actinomadura chibensis]TYB40128.1 response regulator transcription factor [Actinomadura chibensis]